MEDNRRKDKLQFLAEHLISLGFCAFSLLIVCWNQVGWLPWLAGGFLLWWGVLWLLRTHNAWFRPKDKSGIPSFMIIPPGQSVPSC